MAYYLESDDRDLLREMLYTNVCAVCSAKLEGYWDAHKKLPYLECSNDPNHEGIAKEYREPREKNIPTRREEMEQTMGVEKTQQLIKYHGVTTLTREATREIITTIWPAAEKASPAEVFKAIQICVQYGLNPLMNHLFLLPFDKKDKAGNVIATTYATVLGIGANRLIASRKHSYSYLDDTPRLMSMVEQNKIFGSVDESKIRFITKLQDTKTGAMAQGYGEWNKMKTYANGKQYPNEPKGTDKGNSMENMSATRSERAALARLYPADLPDIPVVDEEYEKSNTIDVADVGKVDKATGEIVEGEVVKEIEPEPVVEIEPEPELPIEDTVAELAEQVKVKLEKDETPITPEQLKHITEIMSKTDMSYSDLANFTNKDKKWNIKKMTDLKSWQFDIITDAFKQGEGNKHATNK